MIIDSMKNKARYFSVHPAFEKAFGFIEKCLEENLPDGRYEIEGDKVFANVQSYTPGENKSRFEAHRKYADIQFIASGEEYMECTNISKGTTAEKYNPEKDVEFFSAPADVRFTLQGGEFAVFFPQDLHNPGIKGASGLPVKKILIKLALD